MSKQRTEDEQAATPGADQAGAEPEGDGAAGRPESRREAEAARERPRSTWRIPTAPPAV